MVEPRLLQGRYRLERRIASGGMGTVYEARDERLHRKVAVKLLKDDLAHDPRFVERFRREARAVASLAHPAIANVYDYGEDDGAYFIVMQFAEGEDLAGILRREGPMEPGRAAIIAEGVCAALAHAHAAGIVHRDVKPANIIVGSGDRVVVTDFGIARAAGESTLTGTGAVLGSAHYLSPEQASGGRVGPASDIYSLGIVLYEMLTGKVPFTADTPVAIAMRHVSDGVPAPSATNPSVPFAYDQIVARATAKDEAARFPHAGAFAATLRTARDGGRGTAVIATTPLLAGDTREQTEAHSALPLEGSTAARAGRLVVFGLLGLAALAAALLLLQALAGDGGSSNRRPPAAGETEETTTTSTPRQEPELVVPETIVGMPFKDVKELLEGTDLGVKEEKVAADAEKDVVVGSSPEPGSPVSAGETITLLVSDGPDEEDDEGEEDEDGKGKGKGPHDVPPGQEKKEGR